MGQAQSDEAAIEETAKENAPTSSVQSVIAEATTYGSDENESIDAGKALECPCIADLRKGPCGSQFSEALLCYLKSSAEEKGSDCVHAFLALQSCIKDNPAAFSKDMEEEEEKNVEEASPGYRVHPPPWSLESQGSKSRL